jgi:hypothetical protein
MFMEEDDDRGRREQYPQKVADAYHNVSVALLLLARALKTREAVVARFLARRYLN